MAEALAALLPAIAEREAQDPEPYPVETMKQLFQAGMHSGPFSASLGGNSWTLLDSVSVIEALSSASPSAALLLSMPLGLAGVLAIDASAVPAAHRDTWNKQVERIAGDYANGQLYAACNSEKGAGGSLESTRTVAHRNSDGRITISGEKILASSGRYAKKFFSTAKITPEDLPGAGVVELFLVDSDAPGVEILDDWDGFGMRSTESQSVRYDEAPVAGVVGFPDFIATIQPLQYWFCLFAAIPLGCASSILQRLATPTPASPALRLRFVDAQMRIEALRAYLRETASLWRPAAGREYAQRVLRTKTYVSQESTRLSAELFALSGGRHYRRTSDLARSFADSFAGTALRPPLGLGLEMLVEQFSMETEGT